MSLSYSDKRSRIKQIVLIGTVTACSSFIISVCVAKMSSGSIETDMSAMQIAKWSVSMNSCSDDGVSLIAGGETKNCSLTVTNGSEVASDYVIEVSNIPEGVKVGLGDGELLLPENGAISFTETGGELGIGEERPHVLHFGADLATDADENEMTVSVSFAQKDPR